MQLVAICINPFNPNGHSTVTYKSQQRCKYCCSWGLLYLSSERSVRLLDWQGWGSAFSSLSNTLAGLNGWNEYYALLYRPDADRPEPERHKEMQQLYSCMFLLNLIPSSPRDRIHIKYSSVRREIWSTSRISFHQTRLLWTQKTSFFFLFESRFSVVALPTTKKQHWLIIQQYLDVLSTFSQIHLGRSVNYRLNYIWVKSRYEQWKEFLMADRLSLCL